MLTDRYIFWLACINVYKRKKRGNCMTRQWMKVREREKHWVVSFYVSVSVYGFVCIRAIQQPRAYVSVSKHSHLAHITPGLYPSNCRSQSDIVPLWLLSMVLHISPEMTKSFGQCPWPPASLLVLLHSHSLMWPWTGIGHQPHSRDWYRFCCSHAYRSAELSGQLVFVWLSVCVSCPLSSTEWVEIISAITLKKCLRLHTEFEPELKKKLLKPQKCHDKLSSCCPPTSLQIKALILLHEKKWNDGII